MCNRIQLRKKFFLVLLLVFSVLLSFGSATTWAQDTPNNTTKTIQMSEAQFNSLKTTTRKLRENYNKQQQELTTLQKQLQDSKESLQKANTYLTDYKENLTTLKGQTNELLEDKAQLEKQRNIAWIVAGGLLIWGCGR